MRIAAAALGLAFLSACGGPGRVSGLRPAHPAPPDYRVDSGRPTLRWEPFPIPGHERGVSDVTYDLRIRHRNDMLQEREVYARDGLPQAEHTVEAPLQPEGTHVWTVRARFLLDGLPRETQWSRLLRNGPGGSDGGFPLVIRERE